MTVYLETRIHRYVGLSSDTKPADESLPGSLFYETDTRNWFVWNGAAWTSYSYPYSLETARSNFIAQVLDVMGDVRRFWLPSSDETTTAADQTRNQATLTHNATVATRLHRLGLGYYVDYDGSTNYSTFPDADDLSFGNASADEAFSVVMLVNITNTANNRTLFGKYTTNQREYRAYLATNDTLQFALYDESSDGAENLSSNAAITQDDWILLVLTYDGSEDSDGMKIYVDGLPIAVTATSDVGATYTAMENGTSVLAIGSGTGAASLPFQGGIAAFALGGAELTADQVWQLRNLFDGYFDFLG
ncbi:MAG: LamG-like jellyroll fold domain-containing protein [Dehalococcoidia bacterium]